LNWVSAGLEKSTINRLLTSPIQLGYIREHVIDVGFILMEP